MCVKLDDLDLKEHMSDLMKLDLKGNDFQTCPLKNVDVDLVDDLNHRYLQDLRFRKM